MRHALLTLIILLNTAVCYADGPIESSVSGILNERLLPEYLPCTYENQRYACYSLEQQRELLKLEVSAKTWFTEISVLKRVIESKYLETRLTEAQLQLANENLTITTQLVDRQAKQLDQAIKEKNDWRAKAETPVIWPYVVGGVVGVLGVGFGIGAWLGSL